MTKIHLIADSSLGGLLREYTETDRKADVGDYVFSPFENKTFKVLGMNGEGTAYNVVDELTFIATRYTTALSPTDIIHVDGEMFRMVDRKAEVGEKVIVMEDRSFFKQGEIFTVETTDFAIPAVGKFNDYNVVDGYYRILEPVEAAPEAEALTEVTTANASEQVIEMLANLSQRIVALEAENKRQNDELDTLHRNNVRLGEELERYRAEAKTPATTEVDAVDFSGFVDAVAAKVADRIAKGLSR